MSFNVLWGVRFFENIFFGDNCIYENFDKIIYKENLYVFKHSLNCTYYYKAWGYILTNAYLDIGKLVTIKERKVLG